MAAEAEAEYLTHVGGVARKVVLCGVYIAMSASLIRFNKFLMHEDRFPFSMTLTAVHMSCSSLLCILLHGIRPSLFPGMASTEGQRKLVFQWFAPIAVLFAISLYTSNQAYLYCSVSFLQFLKEGNVIISFLMSCAVGLQILNRLRLAIVIWIILGATLSVSGEMHFVLVGFAFQVISQFAECARVVMGEFVLTRGSLRLDPLSYTMFTAPTCLVVLCIGHIFSWQPQIPHQLVQWWHYLLPNALLAFCLNVVVATIIKEVSAVGFILTGLVKDIAIVLFSCAAFGEQVTRAQLSGFALTLVGVFFWSYTKAVPDSPVVAMAEGLLGLPRSFEKGHLAGGPIETTMLLGKAAPEKV